MNYYDSRQRIGSDPAIWDYTCQNDGQTWPVGFCSKTVGCPNWSLERPFIRCETSCELCHGEQRVPNPDYCGGHDTRADAQACFARFLAAQGSREVSYGDWTGCEQLVRKGDALSKCDTPTKLGLTSRHLLGHSAALCDTHRTVEVFESLAPTVGQITASY